MHGHFILPDWPRVATVVNVYRQGLLRTYKIQINFKAAFLYKWPRR